MKTILYACCYFLIGFGCAPLDAYSGNYPAASDVCAAPDSSLGGSIVAAAQHNAAPIDNTDWDEDKAPAEIDCDDKDSNTYPGAFELCDYRDNDCDGLTDEDWKTHFNSCYGERCVTIGENDCETEGIWGCAFNRTSLACNAKPRLQEESETCNEVDDDCNGIVDDPWPELNMPCSCPTDASQTGYWYCDTYFNEPACSAGCYSDDRERKEN